MSNILPPAKADSISFDPPRTKEALAGVIEDGEIAGLGHEPLPDEFINPNPQSNDAAQAEERAWLDPIVAEQLEETRSPNEVVADGQRAMAEEEFNGAVNTEIDRRGRVLGTFERNQQKFNEEVSDYSDSIYPTVRN